MGLEMQGSRRSLLRRGGARDGVGIQTPRRSHGKKSGTEGLGIKESKTISFDLDRVGTTGWLIRKSIMDQCIENFMPNSQMLH